MQKPKIYHCFNCGAELPPSRFHDQFDTCGERECDREARNAMQAEREEAHEQLDRDMGW